MTSENQRMPVNMAITCGYPPQAYSMRTVSATGYEIVIDVYNTDPNLTDDHGFETFFRSVSVYRVHTVQMQILTRELSHEIWRVLARREAPVTTWVILDISVRDFLQCIRTLTHGSKHSRLSTRSFVKTFCRMIVTISVSRCWSTISRLDTLKTQVRSKWSWPIVTFVVSLVFKR
jgi:hypothetical protein